ncbi:glycoside hydrolase family 43 protein [Paenibacillus protaetiae]|uniref:Glycoside hydrolase n=1 Tax=Paenibacillus protaetiae TaxID=2509456 RepID=A0A4P6EVP6_9BACL|nr:glycoside hydrolase family 43 protein [Paenibacillus protaetiae]QAY67112.1 glycoside hydrolase [Paenibacillus protaetiae]
MPHRTAIRIRDPYVLAEHNDRFYYLYGTTDDNVWNGPATGFDVYRSRDLDNWEGPYPAFRPEPGFWADRHYWAPEVYSYNGRYYMFASFKSEHRRRGTQVLVAKGPLGPFEPLTGEPVTPREWECLDGTLHLDGNGSPWIVFCHEWLQVKDGKMCAMPLKEDLRRAAGKPVVLFSASEAPWTKAGQDGTVYVTDGPFLHRLADGGLLMLWSSSSRNGYAIGVARSESGSVTGPWTHDPEPLLPEEGGHGMLFRAFDGGLVLAMHAPNKQPNERAVFIRMEEKGGKLKPLRSGI